MKFTPGKSKLFVQFPQNPPQYPTPRNHNPHILLYLHRRGRPPCLPIVTPCPPFLPYLRILYSCIPLLYSCVLVFLIPAPVPAFCVSFPNRPQPDSVRLCHGITTSYYESAPLGRGVSPCAHHLSFPRRRESSFFLRTMYYELQTF